MTSLDYEFIAGRWEVFDPISGRNFFVTRYKFVARFICWASARSFK